ncbi:MAG TPA: hypothetical protein VN554_02730 [Verrucomicrobiae bacterium]|nr:hypothetical protein [Verrucomicrobiae bacterium]
MGILDGGGKLTPTEALELGLYDISPEARGSGLPVLEPTVRVAQQPHEMRQAADRAASFTRAIRFIPPTYAAGKLTLREGVQLLDDELLEVAEHCGALVISHRWGLINARSQPYTRHPQSPLVPSGYMLVAEVDALKDPRPLSPPSVNAVEEGVFAYRCAKQPDQPFLSDLYPEQFLETAGEAPADQPRLYLTDIDGRFK